MRDLCAGLARLERETERFERQLIVALSYSGRSELARAARLIAEEARAGTLAPEAVDESAIAARLYAPDVPDPDLIIRTSGEMRISNFLLWQCAYSEFYDAGPVARFSGRGVQRGLGRLCDARPPIRRRQTAAGGRGLVLKRRIIGGVLVGTAWLFGLCYMPGWMLFSVLLLMSCVCQNEFYQMMKRNGHLR